MFNGGHFTDMISTAATTDPAAVNVDPERSGKDEENVVILTVLFDERLAFLELKYVHGVGEFLGQCLVATNDHLREELLDPETATVLSAKAFKHLTQDTVLQ